jgi:hypothetical protein
MQGGRPRAYVWIDEAMRARLGVRRPYAPRARIAWLRANPDEPLSPRDHIHHLDGDTLNDDPGNLTKLTNRQHGEEHGRLRAPTAAARRQSTEKTCEICGARFLPKRGRETTARFCSRACNAKGQAGPDNPNRGKPLSEERRRAISVAKRGRTWSPEHRARLSEIHRERWRKIKEAHQ